MTKSIKFNIITIGKNKHIIEKHKLDYYEQKMNTSNGFV